MKAFVISTLLILGFHCGFAYNIVGPITVTAGQNGVTYSYNDGIVYSSFVWYLTNSLGVVYSPVRSGTTYTCKVDWKTAGSTSLVFSAYGTTKATLSITVNCPTMTTPNATFSYPNGTSACGSLSITYTASPPTGLTWYWQTSSTGTSTANSSKSFTATASGTYYLRAKCLNSWSTAQATASVTVKTIPTVTATDVTICSGAGANLVLTNDVPSTTNTWTVTSSNVSGASNSSGISSSSSPYTYTLNETLYVLSNASGTATYTVTPSAAGCTGTAITKTVTVNPIPSASAPGQTICSGSTAVINLTTNGVSGATYAWTVNQTNVTGATIPGSVTSTSQTLSSSSNVTGTASYTIVPAASGCTGVAANVVINVNPNPNISVSNLSPAICSGASTNITFSSAVSGTTFTWSVAPSNVTGAQSNGSPVSAGSIVQALFSQNGVNTGTVSYNLQSSATFANGVTCTSSGATTVTVKPIPTASAPGQTICAGNTASINLTTNGVSGATYTWSVTQTNVTGATTPGSTVTSTNQTLSTSGSVPGTANYSIVPAADGCTGSTANVLINVNPIPTISLNNLSPALCSGASTNVAFSSGVSGAAFTWTVNSTNVTGAQANPSPISAGAIAQSLSSQDGQTSGTVTYNLQSSATFANGGTCTSTGATTVTVKPKPVAAAVNKTFFNGSAVSVTLSSTISGSTYTYAVSSVSNVSGSSSGTTNPLVQSLSLTSSNNPGTVTYLVTPSFNGCTGTPANTVVSIYPQPIITASATTVYMGSKATLTAQSFYDTYNWSSTLGQIPGNTNSISVSKASTYSLSVIKNGITSPGSATVIISGQFDGQNLNYFVSNSLQAAISDSSKIKLLPVDSLQQSIQYFDGHGRSIQSIITQGSPLRSDVVQAVSYDAYGRRSRSYLPFTSGNNGWYKGDPIGDVSGYTSSAQYNFYNSGAGDKVIDDVRPFSEVFFENSELNRPDREYGPGNAWAPVANNKYVQHAYFFNANGTTAGKEQVIVWKIDPSTELPVRNMASNAFLSSGYYQDGQLSIKSTKDEEGNEVREYTDRSGRMVLKKVQYVSNPTLNNRDHWAQTYYIYDDLGRLRFVLQPELSKTLHASGTTNPTPSQLKNFGFQYKYDGRNRMIQKQVPGADTVYMVYDGRDRIVLTQDGNQRNADEWTFTKYDYLNRPVLTGKYTSTNTRALMQTAVNNYYSGLPSENWYEQEGTVVHGYTNRSFPDVSNSDQYLSATYYDNYNFRDNYAGGAYNFVPNDIPGMPPTPLAKATGQITGAKTKVLGTPDFLWSITYYDDRYRPIQAKRQNYKGGIDLVTTLYDFPGKILMVKTTHSSSQVPSLTSQERNEYDHGGRLLKQYNAISQPSNKVVWIDKVNVTENGDELVKSGATAGYNAGARTQNYLRAGENGWIEVTAQNNSRVLFGLTDSDVDANYTSIDFAMYLSPAWGLTVYENGLNRGSFGTYAAGDVMRVERINGGIQFKKNGVTLYTSLSSSQTKLFGDVSLYNTGDKIVAARMSVGPEYLITASAYNELGQLIDKRLTGADNNYVQSTDYRYNIRGWLTSINNAQLESDAPTNDEADDLFGMELLYNSVDASLNNSSLYNGNISAVKWKSPVEGTTALEDRKSYLFNYDRLNRLTQASFAAYKPAANWTAEPNTHNEILTYDQNGNIKTLQRNKAKAGLSSFSIISDKMDDLVYTYIDGNQLNQVEDAMPDDTGFKDGVSVANEYTYDKNGNMIKDLNKGISSIAYNLLNLPSLITFSNGNTIQYVYDAAGAKLRQTVTENSVAKVTDYDGNIVYERDTLRFFALPEGRVVNNGGNYEYEFMLKDHLGNTRVLFGSPFEGNNLLTNSDCKTLDYFINAQNVTRTLETIDGESYIKFVANQSTSTPGMITTGYIAVQPGEKYTYKVKGYRANDPVSPAYLYVLTNAGDLIWPGANLPYGAENENWVFNDFAIPEGVTSIRLGVFWREGSGLAIGDTFYLNELALFKHQDDDYAAGFEVSAQSAESLEFANYHTEKINNTGTYSTTGSSAYRLTASTQVSNEVIGPAKSIRVYPGDAVHVEVYGRYLSGTGSGTNVGAVIAGALQSAFGLSAGGATDVAYQSIGGLFGGGSIIGTAGYPYEDPAPPKAFLNYILFDDNYVPYDFGYDQIDADGAIPGTTSDKMSLVAKVRKPGYIYIYLSNENPVTQEVYFDDLKIRHVKGVAIQENDYYPFGLTFNSYQRENSLDQRWNFQGQEHIDDLGLNWESFKWRNHQPDIGRFFSIDPLADRYVYNTPYAFSENHVTTHIELEGLEKVHFQAALTDGDKFVSRVNFTVDMKETKVKVTSSAAINPFFLEMKNLVNHDKMSVVDFEPEISKSDDGSVNVHGDLSFFGATDVDLNIKIEDGKLVISTNVDDIGSNMGVTIMAADETVDEATDTGQVNVGEEEPVPQFSDRELNQTTEIPLNGNPEEKIIFDQEKMKQNGSQDQ